MANLAEWISDTRPKVREFLGKFCGDQGPGATFLSYFEERLKLLWRDYDLLANIVVTRSHADGPDDYLLIVPTQAAEVPPEVPPVTPTAFHSMWLQELTGGGKHKTLWHLADEHSGLVLAVLPAELPSPTKGGVRYLEVYVASLPAGTLAKPLMTRLDDQQAAEYLLPIPPLASNVSRAFVESIAKVAVASVPCFGGGIDGLRVSAVVWAGRADESMELVHLASVLDAVLDIGRALADVALHQVVPGSASTDRVRLPQILTIVGGLGLKALGQLHEESPLVRARALREVGRVARLGGPELAAEVLKEIPKRSDAVLALVKRDQSGAWLPLDRETSSGLVSTLLPSDSGFDRAFVGAITEVLPALCEQQTIEALDRLKKWVAQIDQEAEMNSCVAQAATVGLRWRSEPVIHARCADLLLDLLAHSSVGGAERNGLLQTTADSWGLWPKPSREAFLQAFQRRGSVLEEDYRAFEQAVARPGPDEASQSGPVLVLVASQKGGVGKTTVAAAVALGLARKGMKTLLFEFDLGGASLGFFCNVQQEKLTVDRLFARLEPGSGTDTQLDHLWAPFPDLWVLPMPTGHAAQSRLMRDASSSFRADRLREKNLAPSLQWAGRAGIKVVVLDLAAEYRSEAAITMSLSNPTLVLFVARPFLQSLLPAFEWLAAYGVGPATRMALVVNRIPPILRGMWAASDGLADQIFASQPHLGLGTPFSRAYIQAIAPWDTVWALADIAELREPWDFTSAKSRDITALCNFATTTVQAIDPGGTMVTR